MSSTHSRDELLRLGKERLNQYRNNKSNPPPAQHTSNVTIAAATSPVQQTLVHTNGHHAPRPYHSPVHTQPPHSPALSPPSQQAVMSATASPISQHHDYVTAQDDSHHDHSHSHTDDHDEHDHAIDLMPQHTHNGDMHHTHRNSTIPAELTQSYHPALDILSQSAAHVYNANEHSQTPQSIRSPVPTHSPQPVAHYAADTHTSPLPHSEHPHAHNGYADYQHDSHDSGHLLNDSALTIEHLEAPTHTPSQQLQPNISEQQQQSMLNTIATLNTEIDSLRRAAAQSDTVIKTLQYKLSTQSDEIMDLKQDNIRLINEFESSADAHSSVSPKQHTNGVSTSVLSEIQTYIDTLEQVHKGNVSRVYNCTDSLHTAVQICTELQQQYTDNMAVHTLHGLVSDAEKSISQTDVDGVSKQLISIRAVLNPVGVMLSSKPHAQHQHLPPTPSSHNTHADQYAVQSIKQQYELTIHELDAQLASMQEKSNAQQRDKFVLARKIEELSEENNTVVSDLNDKIHELTTRTVQLQAQCGQLKDVITSNGMELPVLLDEQAASDRITQFLSASMPYTTASDDIYSRRPHHSVPSQQQRYYTPQVQRYRAHDRYDQDSKHQQQPGLFSRLITLLFGEADESDTDEMSDVDDGEMDKVLIV